MVASTQVLGTHGEALALFYLESKQWDIRGQNLRFGRYEIDLVAYDPHEQMIVFVEVKTRSRHSHAYPIHTAVDARKRRALREGIFRWLAANEYDGPARIDIICVAQKCIVEHIRDVGSDFY